jgi:beta-galactosidase
MKRGLFTYLLLISVGVSAQTKSNSFVVIPRSIPFDNDWFFTKDNISNAEQVDYNDTKWRKVDLPHDWSIEDLPNQVPGSVIGPFDKGSPGSIFTGFTIGGTGWYRKKFVTGKAEQNKQVAIHFDGVYMNSDVWLNGHHLGNHPHGYTPFYYDLTPYLKPAGQENVLAVKVRNEGRNARWYSGSGIYRHVWLTITELTHIAPWGIYITTPEVSNKSATVQVRTTVNNKQASGKNVQLVTTILSPEGMTVGHSQQALTLEANATKTGEQNIAVNNPALWSVETPRLYKAVTEIKEGSKTIDQVEAPFGIRSLSFTAQNGFLLNGKRVLLKGGCIHHDNGPLGAAAIDRAEERKIEILKQNGFNAIRCSHNPPSKQFLDICDRLGMLVIDEAFDMWEKPKMPQDYHQYFKEWWRQDLEAMLLRDRNHPSVIIWSIGNEIPERVDSSGLRITKQLADKVHQLDPSRPVTEAHCGFWDHPTYKWDTTAQAFALLDIGGYNYLWKLYEPDHKQFPNRIMLGTESHPKDALENWNLVEKYPYVIGDFVWTAMDYLGEASTGNASLDSTKKKKRLLKWPWFNAWCGDIDLVGNKKPQSYYRDVVWRNKPIAMAVHSPIPEGLVENISDWGWPDEHQSWTWPGAEGKSLQVRVFSRAPMVRLILNGKVIGEQKIADSSITAVFQVPYHPGTLKAVNVVNGKETDAIEFKTAGAPKRIRLVADRKSIHASRNDLSYVMVEVIDDKGQLVPNAEIPIQFSISGAGEIAGVGNTSPTELASFKRPERKTVNGKCLAIIRSTGKIGTITLKATANGLKPAQIVITTH